MRVLRLLLLTVFLYLGPPSVALAAIYTVNTTADTDDLVCDVADCTLREAINAANGNAGNHTIEFNIPIVSGVAVISPGSALPTIARNNLVIDGTTQTTNNGNTNPVTLGTGGTVGVDALPLSQVAGPEIEIQGDGVIPSGLRIQATNVTIRGFAIVGFGTGDGEGAIVIDDGAGNALIENNVLGSSATTFTDPVTYLPAVARNYAHIASEGGDFGTIQNNLMGFSEVRCLRLGNVSTNWTIQGNECRDSGVDDDNGDGFAFVDSSDNSVIGNLITGASTQGFVDTGSTGNSLTNNTLSGNGVGSFTGGFPSAGIAIRSTTSDVDLVRNIIRANYGAGLGVNNGATNVVISQNSFADNGTIAARDLSPATNQIGIDLNAPGDNSNLGTSPFYTINDNADIDTGGNTLLNFPVLDTATVSGGNLTLTGWSLPGAIIELFITDGDPSGFGEGETYVGTFVEGSLVPAIDTDASVTLYSGVINGLAQGTNTTNRFNFTVPAPAGVVDGSRLTATGTIGSQTSEFSGAVTAVAMNNISGTVFEDIAGNVLDGAEAIGDAVNPFASGVDVYLYLDDGGTPGSPDATDSIQNGGAPVPTDGSGDFTFPDNLNGTYWVVVDSRTVSPGSGVHPSYLATTPWAEQTFGPTTVGAPMVSGVAPSASAQGPVMAEMTELPTMTPRHSRRRSTSREWSF